MKEEFKILYTGNFYFPIKDKGKKFSVGETLDIEIDSKYNEEIEMVFKFKKILDFSTLAKIIWESCKKELKNYKKGWIVLIRLTSIGKNYVCTVDVLREIK